MHRRQAGICAPARADGLALSHGLLPPRSLAGKVAFVSEKRGCTCTKEDCQLFKRDIAQVGHARRGPVCAAPRAA